MLPLLQYQQHRCRCLSAAHSVALSVGFAPPTAFWWLFSFTARCWRGVIWCYMMLYKVISFDVDMHHPHWSWRDTPWSPDGHTIRNLRTAWTECRERFMISRTRTQEIWHIHLAALLFLITRNGQGKGSRRLHISCNTQDKLLLEPGIDITKAFWVGKWFISCQCGLDCRRSQILEAITASAKPVISDELWPELAPGSTCPCWHRNRFLEQQGRQTQQPLQHCW